MKGRLALLRTLSLAGGPAVVALATVLIVAALLPAAFAGATGAVVASVPDAVRGGFDSSAGRRLVWAIVVVAALLLSERLLSPLNEIVRWTVARRIDGALRHRVLTMLERPSDIAHLEDPTLQDDLGLLKAGLFGTIGTASVAALGIVGRYVQTLAALAIVAWFSVPLAVLVLVVIVAIRVRWHRAFGELARTLGESGSELRRVTYTVDLAITPAAAKEVRIFGLLDWLVDKADRYWAAAIAGPLEVRRRLRASANVELALLGAGYVVTFVAVARSAVLSGLSLGVVAAILQAEFTAAELISPGTDDFATPAGIAGLAAVDKAAARTALPSVVDSGDQNRPIGRLWRPKPTTKAADRFAGAPTLAQDWAPPRGGGLARGCDTAPEQEIRFEGVGFAYPGAEDRPVLDHLDLTIRAGESLAVVGLNGAGKTTFVKLLAGLYGPTDGRILVDGMALDEIDPRAWRRRLGVIFQDFAHYDLSLRENVAPGRPRDDIDDAAVDRALDLAGATELGAALPKQLDTILSRQYEGGADLSGGQWQRVALARALYAVETGAGVLVLDEPTANLDVRAEAELFDAFLTWTAGRTTVLISHRFSTVRRADRIVVLESGRVVEDGTHAGLLAIDGGRYAAMFYAQAEQFTDTDTGTGADGA